MSLTYPKYLNLEQLLNLQQPRSPGPEHDEMLFIVIHQVYELWFKQILHELKFTQKALQANNEADCFHALKRILSVLKVLVAQTDILETMTPIAFNAFRDRLETSSGFQSVQFREVEIMLGKRDISILSRYKPEDKEYQTLEPLFEQPCLWDSFVDFIKMQGYHVPEDVLNRDYKQSISASPELQKTLIKIYYERSNLMEMCERLVDLDEGLQEWRYRHVKMVERTIGMKRGTGGSTGVDYLKNTVFKPLFPDLWEIRASL